ncbi:MAG TPA: aminoacyl-tRNA hydrolase [Verrucomicrobiae bacterium]|nr:aminoacyl-tRNA hydrolase [Verrucomicrobiae bacterium]
MENLYLIAGLGNPGAGYTRTRHNVGFMVVERLARRWQAEWALDDRFRSRLANAERNGRRLALCEPQTFMNLSGESVGRLKEYFRVPLTHLLVIVDDADLPLGEIRLRKQGSSGGHHGLESVEQHLGTRVYPRLRIGIGRTVNGVREITGHVLGRFSTAEAGLMEKILDRAADQAECWLDAGIEKAMSQFNGVVENSGIENK